MLDIGKFIVKASSKEELEKKLRIYAQVKDYPSILKLLKDNRGIDVNSQDFKTKKSVLDILLDSEETVERNQTILLLSDQYGAKGLSKEKRKELSRGFIEDDEELYFEVQEFPSRASPYSPFSSVTTEEDISVSPAFISDEESISPKSANTDIEHISTEQTPKKIKKAISKTLGEEAKNVYDSRRASRSSSFISSGEEEKNEQLVEEEQPKVKQIERIDLTGHKSFTPEHIIENDLIAKSALQGDLTIASDMVNRVIDSEKQGADTALKNGFSEIITAFPGVYSQADEPRNAAFIVYNDLKKQFDSISDMTMKYPEIIAVTSRDDFQKSKKRLPSAALAEDLKQAQGILRRELPNKIEEAKGIYQSEKDKVTEITRKFTDTVNLVTDRIDLSDYQTPKLDHYSAELKDIVVNAMGKNKNKFASSKVETKAQTKAIKIISDFEAKKSVVKSLPALSDFANDTISSYHDNYSKKMMEQLQEESSKARDRIMQEVASKYQEDPKFSRKDFMDQNKIFDLTDDPTYSEAFKEVFALQQTSQESQNLVRFSEGKKQEAQAVIEEIQADLVPIAVRLHQLNNRLEPDDRMDPKNLHAYINAALVAQLDQHLPKREVDPTLKIKFSKIINDPYNKEAFKLTEDELQRFADPKEEMKKLLGQVGLKPQILEKTPVMEISTQEQDAVKKLGAIMLGAGVNQEDSIKRVNPFALGFGPRDISKNQ